MKKFFSKKSRVVFCIWAFIGILLLILISQFEGTFSGSCIISGVIHHMVQKEKAE